MLAIAVLFFLVVWVFITLFAMHIGSKILKKRMSKSYAGKLGGFLGFMLTMGGFMVYWTVEYIQIQRTVTHLCETEGGITVYVTPEEWRQQIGEEEWATLVPYTKEEVLVSTEQEKKVKVNNTIFRYSKGNAHLIDGILENNKIALYTSEHLTKPIFGNKSISLVIEKETNRPLIKETSFYYGTGAISNNLSALKFWLNNIESCNYTKEFMKIAREYSNTITTGA